MSLRSSIGSELDAPDSEYGASEALSLIDRHSSFEGTFRTEKDLRIEGEIKGTVICQGLLFVAQGAKVNATIEAESVSVAGDLEGEVVCRGRLQLLPSGRVRGRVQTGSLVINEGAFYEGQLEMTAPDERGRNGRGTASGPVPISSAADSRGSNTFIRRLGGEEKPWDESSAAEPTDAAASEQD